MKKCSVLWVLSLLLAIGVMANAELQLFDDMENTDGGTVDGRTPNGVLGGLWDTHTEGSSQGGNESSKDGSRTLRILSNSSGDGRGTAFNGVSDTIDDTETGVVFFRFNVSSERSNPVGTYIGVHTRTGTDPMNTTNNIAYINAGFAAFRDTSVSTDPYDITTLDRSQILKADLVRDAWYNAWMVVDNSTDTFDLYISEATGPSGEYTLPLTSDLVGTALAFNIATTDPLVGCIFIGSQKPAGLSGQIPPVYFDEFWWDGSNGISSYVARDPNPTHGATDVSVEPTLTWAAPDDPNVSSTLGYLVFVDPNETNVIDGEDVLFESSEQAALSYAPGTLDYETTYYWRVVAKNQLNDANQTVAYFEGDVWSFTTEALYKEPIVEVKSVITTVDLMPLTITATVSNNSNALTTSQFELLDDDFEYPGDETVVFEDVTTDLQAPTATLNTDIPGTYKLLLTVSDEAPGNDEATTIVELIEVVVYADSCEAKKAAPSAGSWAANYYDRSGDCEVDMSDFMSFAGAWLDDTGMDASEFYTADDVVVVPVDVFDARIEAESVDPNDPNGVSNFPITDESGIRYATSDNASGGLALGYTGNNFAQYEINVPAAGFYDVYMSGASTNDTAVLTFGDEEDSAKYGSVGPLSSTGGWGTFVYTKSASAVEFPQVGLTTVRITWSSSSRNLDWFAFVPVAQD